MHTVCKAKMHPVSGCKMHTRVHGKKPNISGNFGHFGLIAIGHTQSTLVRAPCSHRGGHWFESSTDHRLKKAQFRLIIAPKRIKTHSFSWVRILSFSAQSAVQITRFLGRKYGYLVLPTVLMPQKLTLFLCSSYKLFCPCYQIPGLYINWLSPSQLIKCNTMGAKKQEKKRLIRIRSRRFFAKN